MLRRETRVRHASLLVASGIAFGGIGLGALVVTGAVPRRTAVFVPVPVPVEIPASPPPVVPAPPAGSRRLDEPIKLIGAASDAPVIAVATTHQVWVSRDGGASFARALAGDGEVASLVVESTGRVYATRTDSGDRRMTSELGILETDGTERWRQPPGGGYLLDARDGRVVMMATNGIAIGTRAGEVWDRVAASREWIPLRTSVGADGVARFLATRNEGSDPALYLLEVRGGGRARVVWSTPFSDGVGGSSEITPCAGFAGDRLYVVVRDHALDLVTKRHTGRLVAVHADGRAEARTLVGQVLNDDGLTCDIAGNDRAAYLSFSTRRIGHETLRIDVAEPRAESEYMMAFDRMAVDAHGRLLHLAHGWLGRISESGRATALLLGSDAPQ